jgi:subtilase family serine protease
MSERQQLHEHVTSEMLTAPRVGPLQKTLELTLTVGLVIDGNALAEKAMQVSDPQSPTYRQYTTPEEVADTFGASTSDYQALLDWGTSNGLVPTAHKNRFVATFSGTVANIEEALQIHLNNGLRPDGTEFFGPDREPSIELAIPVEHISGLNNYKPPTRAGGSGPGGEYQGTDFRNAYAPGWALTGEGQSVGIYMSDGFFQSDVDAYAALLNETLLPIEVVPPNATHDPGSSVEGSLDIDMVLAMAPAAQVVAFIGSGTQILAEMADRNDIKQFTSSWFWYDGSATDKSLMTQLATQGQSFFQASGDGGSYAANWPSEGGSVNGPFDCRQFPCITLVGGTDLQMTDDGTSYGSLETAWAGSSGGPIAHVPIPSYQAHIAGHNGASSTLRNVPDVSAQANGGVICFGGPPPKYVGGTSQATPLWAGFMALVNQQAGPSYPSVGFANPALYALAIVPGGALFHDVVSGCANAGTDGTQYCAGPGYDLVTGLGSPTAALLDALLPKALQGLLTKSCAFSLTSYEYTEDEVSSKQLGGNNAVFKGAIVVIVDGFAPSDLQIVDSSSLSKAPVVTFPPSIGLTNPATCSSLVSSDPSFGSEKQQFQFSYDLDFGSDLAAFTSISKTVAINTTYHGLTASTALTLLQGTGEAYVCEQMLHNYEALHANASTPAGLLGYYLDRLSSCSGPQYSAAVSQIKQLLAAKGE